jgi:hypothetical protein
MEAAAWKADTVPAQLDRFGLAAKAKREPPEESPD